METAGILTTITVASTIVPVNMESTPPLLFGEVALGQAVVEGVETVELLAGGGFELIELVV
ncbi:hypothetical protein [Bifidobacterium sp. UTBIF-68]|uniref:hypothetical protein n=1 Tax=Bifidobacterium sp. UTBIF-68 TaxID=1465262 RepID=UPI0015E3816D|nr:hypothetical protein [Bifidobacterium sp. UTBIF-68]